MNSPEFIVREDAGSRLDVFVHKYYEGLSRSYAKQLVEQGKVRVNGAVVSKASLILKSDDSVQIEMPEEQELELKPEDIPLDIVYEDSDVLVVNKAAGMVVHPAPGNYTGTLVNAIMFHCRDSLSGINGVLRPGIVHRIDKDTSGLIMVAKNDRAHESLSKQLLEHSIKREYRALVHDNIIDDEITINKPIGRHPVNRLKRSVNGVAPRDAITHIKVIERFGKYTYICCKLETGRTHQIRVHMADAKHPLVGDPLYGVRSDGDKLLGVPLKGQLLHAASLGFLHPATKEFMEFHSELPDGFKTILKKLEQLNGI